MRVKTILTAAMLAASTCARADIVAPDYGSASTNVASDTSAAGSLVAGYSSYGVSKSGGGTLSFDTAQIVGMEAFSLNVLSGKVAVASAAAREASVPAPAAMDRAALWLKSDANLVYDADQTHVAAWRDARDTQTEGAWSGSYVYAASEALSGIAGSEFPTVRNNEAGQPMLYFHGRQSGSTMSFKKANGSATADISGVRHVFCVTRIVEASGFMLSPASSGQMYFCPGSAAGVVISSDGSTNSLMSKLNISPVTMGGMFFLNGVPSDPTAELGGSGLRVIEWSGLDAQSMSLGAIFRDRNLGDRSGYNRSGGDDIGEVVLFTNSLTTVERVAVERYLLSKWRGGSQDAATLEMNFGDAGGILADTGSGATESVSYSGNPLIEKRGAGELDILSGGHGCTTFSLFGGTVLPQLGLIGVLPASGTDVTCAAPYGSSSTGAVLSASAGTAGAVSLTGPVRYRVGSMPSGENRLTVSANGLSLAAPNEESALNGILSDEVEFEDPSFEKSGYANVSSGNSRTANGWTFRALNPDGYSSSLIRFETLPNSGGTYVQHPYSAPHGTHVLGAKAAYEFWTTVKLPKRGVYELSFWLCKRGTAKVRPTDVAAIQNGVTNWLGRCRGTHTDGFRLQRFKTPILTPGDCTLFFTHTNKADCLPQFDDFHMRYMPQLSSEETVPVPNGNCEMFVFENNPTATSSDDNCEGANTLDGWTFTNSETGSTGFRSVSIVSRLMSDVAGMARYRAQNNYGECHLIFHETGSAETTDAFKVGKGRWKLRMKAAKWASNLNSIDWHGTYLTGSNGKMTAYITVNGGSEISLGAVTLSSPYLAECEFPTTIDLEATDEVKLRLTRGSTTHTTASIVDDLEFVRVDELVAGGDFESSSLSTLGWSSATHADSSIPSLKDANARTLSSSSGNYSNYGKVLGARSLALTQCGEVWQNLGAITAGVYRLQFLMHPRASASSGFNYGGNGVRAFISKGGVTNEIGRTGWICASNFVCQTFYVRVPEDGAWTLGLQGENGIPLADGTYGKIVSADDGFNTNDGTVIVDSVSFRPAKGLGEVPSISSGTGVVLDAGTRLYLDFTGTLELKSLRIGRVRKWGFVDSSDPSGLVHGPGRVFVDPRNCPGFVFTVH